MKELSKQGLLVGGPTVGKTYLLNRLRRHAVAVIDTDLITEKVCPELDSILSTGLGGKVTEFVKKMRDLVVADEIMLSNPKLVLTGLWSPVFMSRLFPHSEGSKVKAGNIYVGRANSLEVTRLSRSRGKALSTGLVSKWTNAAERWASTVFDHVVWLPEGVYLSDVVTVQNNIWVLTDLGIALDNKGRSFANSVEVRTIGDSDRLQLIEVKKGGDHGNI